MSNEQGLTPYETREILFYKTDNGEVRVEILLFQEKYFHSFPVRVAENKI